MALNLLDSRARARYNARRRMETNREQCKVVGSVPNWQTWRREGVRKDLPCDWVELRVDALPPDLSTQEILEAVACKPVLLTLRHKSEGGLRDWEEALRIKMAIELLPMATAVDWEIAQLPHAAELVRAAKAAGVRLIASHHDFEKTPALAEMLALETTARAAGADIVKFAYRVHTMEDVLVGVELLRRASGPMAVMGMDAELGPESRILYAEHGSCLIYGYLGAAPTAPGQWSAERFYKALH